jgi:hypothetical protein
MIRLMSSHMNTERAPALGVENAIVGPRAAATSATATIVPTTLVTVTATPTTTTCKSLYTLSWAN